MKYLTLVFLCFSTFLLLGQHPNHNHGNGVPDLNQKDAKNRKQGEWRYYDTKEKVFVKSQYKNDLLHGSTVFYKNDKLLFRLRYLNHKLNGINQSYKKGKLTMQVELKDNQLHGILQRYDVKKNELRCVQIYKNNIREGKAEYFKKNKLFATATFVKDHLEGDYKTYHPNGKMATKLTYKQGIIVGNLLEYNEEGILIGEKVFDPKQYIFTEHKTIQEGKEVKNKKIKERPVSVFTKDDVNKIFFKNLFYDILPH